jgi:hypothetical protein
MWDPIVEDNFDHLFKRFGDRRGADLHHRFTGWYRAIVEETNDPLNIRRVRVRIPELHNVNEGVDRLCWAVPAPWAGGTNAGSFAHPAIKDIVFVCFEKNHPYSPIYCAAPDSTRRRAYSLWSTYTRTPLAVTENGDPDEQPDDFIEKYLPKDGRPMSTGFGDRYGHFLLFNAHGFFPSTHVQPPTPTGTDAISQQQFDNASQQPMVNDPDLKYIAMGTKYGHFAFLGDQGYNWKEEFEGDFDQDKQFEVDRYKYLIKFFNEQQEKDRDQRRIEFRTRAGHKLELRDVGFDRSRAGEYGDPKDIGNSQGRDERWFKIRTKGGHLIQGIDKGFDPEFDNYYKELNQTDMGSNLDLEDQLGDDSRMLRFVTRHGNMLVLDDRGSSPTAGEEATPHGNGVLLRSRKGYQMQMLDKGELDHILFATPKDQCFEMNDRHQYILLTTSQAEQLHTDIPNGSPPLVKGQPQYISQTGMTNDPEANTCHLKLDNLNNYVRMKTPDGSGFEARGQDAPCGQWVETRDCEDRAVWMSKTDQWLLIRGKKGVKYIILDDNDDAIMIRNEEGKIQIRAKGNIEIKSDDGNICLEATNGEIGLRAKKIAASTNGAEYVWDGQGFGSTRKVQGQVLEPVPRGDNPCKVDPKEISRKKPEDFDKERGCDPVKPDKGPVPLQVTNGGGGGGGGGAGSGQPIPQAPTVRGDPSPFAPDTPGAAPPPTPNPTPDPIEEVNPGGGGVLWYGVSAKFQNEIEEFGLLLNSFSNHLNIPLKTDATEIRLAKSLEVARGKKQAILSQERYGNVALILRIRNVEDPGLLTTVPDDNELVAYKGNIEFDGNIEIFEIGDEEFTVPPLFPNV